MAERTYSAEISPDMPTPALTRALSEGIPRAIIHTWRALAKEHTDTGDYLAALSLQSALRYPYLGDPDTCAVVNYAFHAPFLEQGRAGFHLASRWGRGGGKWKISEDGTLYAHVAFRIGTPVEASSFVHRRGFAARLRSGRGLSSKASRLGSTMPPAVYEAALRLRNHSPETPDRLKGFGNTYKQSKPYDHYRQSQGGMPAELDGESGYTWKASQFEGLFRTTAPTPGGGRHTAYMTIRTITPDSPGWYIPPTPPLRLAERALEESWDTVQALLEAAVAQDVSAAFHDATRGLD